MTPRFRLLLKAFVVTGLLLEGGYLAQCLGKAPVSETSPRVSRRVWERPGGPRANWPAQLDLGDVTAGDSVLRPVPLANLGQAMLTVEGIDSHCGCLKVHYETRGLKPGESLEVGVNYRAPAETGRFTQRLWLRSNDPRGPLPLTVTGLVVGFYQLDPAAINFGRVAVGQSVKRRVRLRALSQSSAFRPSLRPLRPGPIALERARLEPDGRYEVTVSAQPRSGKDFLSSTLVIDTGDARQPFVMVPTFGEIITE